MTVEFRCACGQFPRLSPDHGVLCVCGRAYPPTRPHAPTPRWFTLAIGFLLLLPGVLLVMVGIQPVANKDHEFGSNVLFWFGILLAVPGAAILARRMCR
jgi:hypothetical protein